MNIKGQFLWFPCKKANWPFGLSEYVVNSLKWGNKSYRLNVYNLSGTLKTMIPKNEGNLLKKESTFKLCGFACLKSALNNIQWSSSKM